MKRIFAASAALALAACVLSAQTINKAVPNQSSVPAAGSHIEQQLVLANPSGACYNPQLETLNSLTGEVYACVAGSWASLGAGGGGSTSFSALAGNATDNASLASALAAKQAMLSLPLSQAQGGTGLATVTGLTSGNSNCTVTGAWPNQTVTCTASGGSASIASGATANAGTGTPNQAGGLYYATDAPTTQSPFYMRSAANASPVPFLTPGPSGNLIMTGGNTIDTSANVMTKNGSNVLTGFFDFSQASVAGLSAGGSAVTYNTPYLEISGTNYIPMANMAPATLVTASNYSTDASLTQLNTAPTVTTTGNGAAAPIVANTSTTTPANWVKTIATGATKLRTAFILNSFNSANSNTGAGVLMANGSAAFWCTLRNVPNNGAQATNQLQCGSATNGTISGAVNNVFAAVVPQNAWLGLDISNAGGANGTTGVQISTDGGRTWVTAASFTTGGNSMGIGVPTQWGFYLDPLASAQVLSVVEQ